MKPRDPKPEICDLCGQVIRAGEKAYRPQGYKPCHWDCRFGS